MGISETYIKILKHPTVEATIAFIKKFKSSKSYWSVSYFILLFTIREAIAWKYGSAIKTFCEDQVVDSSFPIFWEVLGFVLDVGGSWELVLLGGFFFIVLSLAKASEGEDSSSKGSYLMLVLFSIIGMSISPLYYLYQGNGIEKVIDKESKLIQEVVEREANKTNQKIDNLSKILKVEVKSLVDTIIPQNISGTVFDEDGDFCNNVKIYLKKNDEEFLSKNKGKYIFKNILGKENEKTSLIVSKLNCDTRIIPVELGQIRNIKLIGCNIKKDLFYE